MADASIGSKPKRYDHPHANADHHHHHADHHHDADGSDGALGARDHAAKEGSV